MFSVFADGPGRYRIEDAAGADAGWIRGRSIGFRGLRSDAEAIVAASAGWRTLRSLLHREFTAWPRQEVDWEHLRFVHDGAHEWVSDGRIPLARVYRTSGTERGRPDVPATIAPAGRLAVEFVVPSWMDMETVVPLARALWHVLAPLLGNTSHDTRGKSDEKRRPTSSKISCLTTSKPRERRGRERRRNVCRCERRGRGAHRGGD